jgi:predicted metalloprotease
LVAHEYAHARLHAVQGFTRNIIWSSVVDEVQADCVAGVYMKAASPIELSSQMLQNSADFVESIGDYMVLEKDWHGTPQMRRTAFLHGYKEGRLSLCAASDRPAVNKVIERSSDAIQNQIGNPDSELNRLIKWGNNLLKN